MTTQVRGLGVPIVNAGAPVAGTSETQTLTIGGTPIGGTFKLRFEGIWTAAITWSATNGTLLANMQAALDAKFGTNVIVASAVSLTAGIGTILLTFGGNRGKQAIGSLITAFSSLTGTAPTLAIAETTPGVNATGRGAPRGAKLIDTDTGIEYVQTSSNPLAPTWSQIEGTGGVATADLADSAVTYAKIQNVSATDKLLGRSTAGAGAVEEIPCTAAGRALLDDAAASNQRTTLGLGALATLATVAAAQIDSGAVTFVKAKAFVSTEQTGTGSPQNVAHGLAAIPAAVLVVVTEHPGTPDTGAFDVAEGAHDGTNVIVTVTANVKFKVMAWV